MNSLTGQYECAHHSALGLDYFTARLDRLTLYANGRFTLVTQEQSRLMNAAKNLAAGQQANMSAPETTSEGSYSSQGDQLFLSFDNGTQERATIQEAGLQFGKDFFEKVSDNTFMPPAQRMKSNMDDIAKGLKIAGTIGGTVMKAAKTLHGTFQAMQPEENQGGSAPQTTPAPSSWQATPAAGQSSAPPQSSPNYSGNEVAATFYCEQCGSPVRAGKKFCNKCGARLT